MTIKPIIVSIPATDLWRLEVVAERRGLTLPEFLYRSALAVAGAGTVGEESIVTFHRAGMSVREIARRLDWTNSAVQARLRRLNLKPNPRTTNQIGNAA